MTNTNSKRNAKNSKGTLVADICLYGNPTCGVGYIASHAGGMIGKGDTVAGRSLTEAIWLAVDALKSAGVSAARGACVVVYMPGGERYAVVPLARVPAFGDMQWSYAAPGYVISADEIATAAKRAA
jgi:hypothetical protein